MEFITTSNIHQKALNQIKQGFSWLLQSNPVKKLIIMKIIILIL